MNRDACAGLSRFALVHVPFRTTLFRRGPRKIERSKISESFLVTQWRNHMTSSTCGPHVRSITEFAPEAYTNLIEEHSVSLLMILQRCFSAFEIEDCHRASVHVSQEMYRKQVFSSVTTGEMCKEQHRVGYKR